MSRSVIRLAVPLAGAFLSFAATVAPAHADVVNLGACQKVDGANQSPGHTGNGPLTVVVLPDGQFKFLLPGGFAGGSGCVVQP
ncbi:MAG TPA: hypothetical protein VFK52_11020 [Nocardioidaceae bacterium]|nr:hypothetical protein [Nocardioidaceae bacterium]